MNQVGQSGAIASKRCSCRASKQNHQPSPLPFTTQGRALARLQAFDLDPAFDPPAPSGGRVEVFIWGSGAKRRAAKPHTSRGGRREADRRRCPQMDTGAREHRALARCRTLGRAFLVPFDWAGIPGVCQKGLAVRAKPSVAITAETDMYTRKRQVGCQAAIAGRPAPTGIGVHPKKTGRLVITPHTNPALSSPHPTPQGQRTKLNPRRTHRASCSFPRPPPRRATPENTTSGP